MMNRSVGAAMPGGGEGVAPALRARARDGERMRSSASARTNADAKTRATRRGRRSFILPTWFNIAATVATAAAIAVGVLLQG